MRRNTFLKSILLGSSAVALPSVASVQVSPEKPQPLPERKTYNPYRSYNFDEMMANLDSPITSFPKK